MPWPRGVRHRIRFRLHSATGQQSCHLDTVPQNGVPVHPGRSSHTGAVTVESASGSMPFLEISRRFKALACRFPSWPQIANADHQQPNQKQICGRVSQDEVDHLLPSNRSLAADATARPKFHSWTLAGRESRAPVSEVAEQPAVSDTCAIDKALKGIRTHRWRLSIRAVVPRRALSRPWPKRASTALASTCNSDSVASVFMSSAPVSRYGRASRSLPNQRRVNRAATMT